MAEEKISSAIFFMGNTRSLFMGNTRSGIGPAAAWTSPGSGSGTKDCPADTRLVTHLDLHENAVFKTDFFAGNSAVGKTVKV